jgi:hypothetical protein
VGFGIVVLVYIWLLYFGAIIVPGVGLSGHLIGPVPYSLFDWAHAPGYGILAMLLTRGLQRRAWPLAYALPVAAAAALNPRSLDRSIPRIGSRQATFRR